MNTVELGYFIRNRYSKRVGLAFDKDCLLPLAMRVHVMVAQNVTASWNLKHCDYATTEEVRAAGLEGVSGQIHGSGNRQPSRHRTNEGMTMLDEGIYIIQLTADSEPEPARYAGDVFSVLGMDETSTLEEVHRVGARVELDQVTLTAWNVRDAAVEVR